MNYIHSFLVLFILQVELCTSQNRYCQEAVDSVTIVESCPTTKAEWDVAAQKKNCGGIASKQDCATVEKFQYHCVVNGLRNKLLEVCAPTRIIFGHCVEFNVLGGVIQDQLSAPCNATFPKCAYFYLSSDIFKYPDCYKLVLKYEGSLAIEEKTITTTSKNTLITTNGSGQEKSFHSFWSFVIISVLIIAVVLVLIIYIRKTLCHRKQPNRKHNEVVYSSVENVEGDVECLNIERKPCMEIKDEKMTCLIQKKVEVEQGIQRSSSGQSSSLRFSQRESAVKSIRERVLSQLLRQPVDQGLQRSSSGPSSSLRFSQRESAVKSIPERVSSQLLRQPVDQDIRRRTSTRSMSQRFARSDSEAYNKGFKDSDFLM